MAETNLLLYGDFGKQVDDELALLAALGYKAEGVADVVGVIGTYTGAEKRTRLARSMLDALGCQHIPAGYGEDPMPYPYPEYNIDPYVPESYEFYTLYPTSDTILPTAKELASQVLENAPDNSVTPVLHGPMEDAAQLLDNEPGLTKRKIAQVVIQAGILADENGPVLSSKGFLQPDNSYNNACSPEAALYVYEELQGRGIPTTFVTRFAARNNIWMGNYMLTKLKMLSPIGGTIDIHARMAFRRNLNEISEPTPGLLLRPNITRDQFLEQFTVNLQDYVPEVIWDNYAKNIYTCDPLAIAATLPSIQSRFMRPHVHFVAGTPYRIVGLNDTANNLLCPGKLRHHLESLYLKAAITYNGYEYKYKDGSNAYKGALSVSKWEHVYKPGLPRECAKSCDHSIPEGEDSKFDNCREMDEIRTWREEVQKATEPAARKFWANYLAAESSQQ